MEENNNGNFGIEILKMLGKEIEKRQEKTADKMFEELDYEKIDKKEFKHLIYTDGNKRIYFHRTRKYIKCEQYIKEEKRCIEGFITMEELKAINKKCEELGWI